MRCASASVSCTVPSTSPGPTLLAGRDGRLELPASVAVERRRRDAALDHRRPPGIVAGPREHGQRALRAVEDRAEQARAELHLERLAACRRRARPAVSPDVSS